MRHRVVDKKLNRDSNHRKALLKNLAIALVERGEITTTQTKAKVLKRLADKLISKAQKATLADRRQLHRFFGKRDVVNTLVERVAPSMSDRVSGFTRIATIGSRRGDNTTIATISLVVKPTVTGLKATKSAEAGTSAPAKKAQKAAKPAAKTANKAADKKAAEAQKATKKTTATKAAPKKTAKTTTKTKAK